MLRCIRSFHLGSLLERGVVRLLQFRIEVFRVDVITDANELLRGVGACQEDDGDADEVGGGNAGRKGCCCLQ